LVLFVHLRVSGSVWIAGLDTPGARSPGRPVASAAPPKRWPGPGRR
jgi:hypothetical protein